MSTDDRADDASSFAFGKLLVVITHFFLVLIFSFVLAGLAFSWVVESSLNRFDGSFLIWLIIVVCLIWFLASVARFFSLFAAYGSYLDGDDRTQLEQSTVNAVMTITALLILVHAVVSLTGDVSVRSSEGGDLEELSGHIDGLNNRDSLLEDQLGGLDKRVTQVSLALENMSVEGKNLSDEIGEQRHVLSARMQEFETLSAGQVLKQSEQLESLRTDVDELTRRGDKVGLGLSAAMHDQSSISEQVSLLLASTNRLQQNERSLADANAALSEKLDSLNSQYAEAINRINSLEQSAEQLSNELAKHESTRHAQSSSTIAPEQQFLDLAGQIPLSGGVLDGLALTFDNARLSPAGDIVGGVTTKEPHVQLLSRLAALIGECAVADNPTQLKVVGFASPRPFRKDGEILAESDALNLATANKRANSVYSELELLLAGQGEAIELVLVTHGSLAEMVSLRPYQESSRGLSPSVKESLARSVLVQLAEPGSC